MWPCPSLEILDIETNILGMMARKPRLPLHNLKRLEASSNCSLCSTTVVRFWLLCCGLVITHCVLTAWTTWRLVHPPRFSLLHNKRFDETSPSGAFIVHLSHYPCDALHCSSPFTQLCILKVCEITPDYILLMCWRVQMEREDQLHQGRYERKMAAQPGAAEDLLVYLL